MRKQLVCKLLMATVLMSAPAWAADQVKADPASGAHLPATTPGQAAFAEGLEIMAQGDAAAAFSAFATAMNAEPDNLYFQTYTLSYLDRGDYNQALAIHEAMVRIAPDSVPLISRLARLKESKGQYAAAERLYQRWAELRPDQAEPSARLGELYFFTKRYAKAIDAFETHLKQVGESDYALRRLAAIYQETGNSAKADQLWRSAGLNRQDSPTMAMVVGGKEQVMQP